MNAKRSEQVWRLEPIERNEQRYADLEALIDYREYEGLWSWRFEEQWLKPRLRDLGYEHIRFFGGTTCDYDGSFRERICELKRPDRAVEYYIYG